MGPAVIFVLFGVVIVALAIINWQQAKARREAMALLAQRLGLRYREEKDRNFASRFRFLDHLCRGSNRYGFNFIEGNLEGHPVLACDYHYETHSTDSKGRRQTHHHYFSYFILTLPKSFPELEIGPEGFFSKIAQAVGYDDIDFESHEFSRRFCVRSNDKKFAYDFCNAQMIEYVLANDDLVIEVEHDCLALFFRRRLAAEQIEGNFKRLLAVRERMPNYMFD